MNTAKMCQDELLEMTSVITRSVPEALTDMHPAILQGWIKSKNGAVAEALRSAFVMASRLMKDALVYSITVNRNLKFEQLVRLAGLDKIDERISKKTITLSGEGIRMQNAILLNLGSYVAVKEARNRIEIAKLRNADFPELCSLCAEHPELLSNYCIYALGAHIGGIHDRYCYHPFVDRKRHLNFTSDRYDEPAGGPNTSVIPHGLVLAFFEP